MLSVFIHQSYSGAVRVQFVPLPPAPGLKLRYSLAPGLLAILLYSKAPGTGYEA